MTDRFEEMLKHVEYEEASPRGEPRRYLPENSAIVVDTSAFQHDRYVEAILDFVSARGRVVITRDVATEATYAGQVQRIVRNAERVLKASGGFVVDPFEHADGERTALENLWPGLPGYACFEEAYPVVGRWYAQLLGLLAHHPEIQVEDLRSSGSSTRRHHEVLEKLLRSEPRVDGMISSDVDRIVAVYEKKLEEVVNVYAGRRVAHHEPLVKSYTGYVRRRLETILARILGAVLLNEGPRSVLRRFERARNMTTDISVVLASYVLRYTGKVNVVVLAQDRDIEALIGLRRTLGPQAY